MARLPFWLPAAALALAVAHDARADYYAEPPPATPPPSDEFWREVVAPHGDEIDMILGKAQTAYTYAMGYATQDYDATGELKAKLLDEAYGMLRYARKLDPTRTDVLQLLGQVAEESGRASAALEALQAYQSEIDPDATIPYEVWVRMGRAYLHLDRTDDAIRAFRAATAVNGGYQYQYGGTPGSALAYLGAALMNEGRTSDAIDAIAPDANTLMQMYYSPDPMQALFTLAVAYDRDEQISSAFTLLDQLQAMLTTSYAQYVQMGIGQMLFVPAYDQHYYMGLYYETNGYLAEARTEWLGYAENKDAPFRGRALDHANAIDKLLAQQLADRQKAEKDKQKADALAKQCAKIKGKKPKKCAAVSTTVTPATTYPYGTYPYPTP